MRVSVYIPLLISVVLALLSPVLARRLPPAAATRALLGSGVIAATASTWSLLLLAVSGLGRNPVLARHVHSSTALWSAHDPVPLPYSAAAATLLVVAGARFALTETRRHRDLSAARQVGQDNPHNELVVLSGCEPVAFAIPSSRRISGRSEGRIAVSVGMLRALSGVERRALFAHERSHLTHRHHRYTHTGALVAALNPLLTRVRNDIDYAVERWADEDAAHAVQSRTVTAAALARAALATLPSPHATLAFHALRIPHRLTALSGPAPTLQRRLLVPVAVITVLAAAATSDATMACTRFLSAVVPAISDALRVAGL